MLQSHSYFLWLYIYIYIIKTGHSDGTTMWATVDIYDVITGQWNSTATGAGSLSIARYLLAGAATGNKIVFAGGEYVC